MGKLDEGEQLIIAAMVIPYTIQAGVFFRYIEELDKGYSGFIGIGIMFLIIILGLISACYIDNKLSKKYGMLHDKGQFIIGLSGFCAIAPMFAFFTIVPMIFLICISIYILGDYIFSLLRKK